jgi:hypothetical protein
MLHHRFGGLGKDRVAVLKPILSSCELLPPKQTLASSHYNLGSFNTILDRANGSSKPCEAHPFVSFKPAQPFEQFRRERGEDFGQQFMTAA